jgi:hypothetical protein
MIFLAISFFWAMALIGNVGNGNEILKDRVNSRKWRRYHNRGKFFGCPLFCCATHE